jgi:hypothetical protein
MAADLRSKQTAAAHSSNKKSLRYDILQRFDAYQRGYLVLLFASICLQLAADLPSCMSIRAARPSAWILRQADDGAAHFNGKHLSLINHRRQLIDFNLPLCNIAFWFMFFA